MKRLYGILIAATAIALPSEAQHYLTAGAGFSLTFYNSTELDRFTDTYNSANSENLRSPLSGFSGAEGLRLEGGYQYFGRLSAALQIGYQRLDRKDMARFNNGEERRLELQMTSFFIEPALGRRWGNLYLHGLICVFLNRKFTLKRRSRPWNVISRGERQMLITPPAALVRHLREGRCVLCAGSGISAATGLPTWHSSGS